MARIALRDGPEDEIERFVRNRPPDKGLDRQRLRSTGTPVGRTAVDRNFVADPRGLGSQEEYISSTSTSSRTRPTLP